MYNRKKKYTYLKIFTTIFFLVFATFYSATYFVISSDRAKQLIAQKFAKHLNAKVIFDNISIKIFPFPYIQIQNINIFNKNPQGKIAEKPFLTIDTFDVFPVLKDIVYAKLSVDNIVLYKPVFNNFYKTVQTHNTISPVVLDTHAETQNTKQNSDRVQHAIFTMIDIIKDNKTTILKGKVILDDNENAINNNINDINITISSNDTNAIILEGNALFRTSRIGLETQLGYLKDNDTKAPVKLFIHSDFFDFYFTGSAIFDNRTDLVGQLDIVSENFDNFMNWVGIETQRPYVDNLSLSTQLIHSQETFILENFSMKFNESSVNGKFKLILGAIKPEFIGTLSFDKLDINDFIARKESHAINKDDIQAIQTIPTKPNKNYPHFLETFKLDLRLSVAQLILPYAIRLNNFISTIQVHDEHYNIQIADSKYNTGHFKGFLKGQKKNKTFLNNGQFQLLDIEISSLAETFFKKDFLKGKAQFDIDISFTNFNKNDIEKTVKSHINFLIHDGSIQSHYTEKFMPFLRRVAEIINIPEPPGKNIEIIKAKGDLFLDKTVLHIKKLITQAAYFIIKSKGDIHLKTAKHNIFNEVTLWPKSDKTGFKIPVTTYNSLFNPDIKIMSEKLLDIDNIIKDPSKAYKALKQIGNSIKKTKPKEIIKKLLKKP